MQSVGACITHLMRHDVAWRRRDTCRRPQRPTYSTDLDPRASVLYTKRAAAYMSLRQASQALRDLNKAIENDDAFVQGYIHRGKLHRQMCK